MPSTRMNFKLTRDEHNYKMFIEELRNKARDPKRESHGRPVLPVPPTNPHDAECIDIELIAAKYVTVKIQRHNLYLIGYRMENGTWFEVSWDDGQQLIDNSASLGFRADYRHEGLGSLENLHLVGYRTLENAINNLAHETNYDGRRHSMRALAVMISEAARFEKLSNIFAESLQKDPDIDFQAWMTKLIHSWGDLSDRLLREDNLGISFRLPRDQDGNDHVLTRELEIATADQASACRGLLLGNFPSAKDNKSTDDSRRRRRHRRSTNYGTSKRQGMGQPLVEVFSVRINNIDEEDPGDIYGTVEVTDGLGSFYLYNRAQNDYESIRSNDVASLTGPYRSISLCGFFSIALDLKDKDSFINLDDEVSKGSFSWDVLRLSTTPSYYDKPLNQLVTGKYGSASVYYTMFRDAVQAKVDVVLIEGDGEDPARVYGTIVARYDNYDYSTPEQKKYYQTTLFNKSSSNYSQVNPGCSIPLSRYVVAVPTTSSLIIEADLWNYDTLSPDVEIAKDTVTFAPETDGMPIDEINGRYGYIQVTVTWSPISDGDIESP